MNNKYMNDDMKYTEYDDYLLVSIQDKIITFQRAQEILARIGEKCSSLNCNTVLLDEMSVVKREVLPKDIEKLVFDSERSNLNKVYMAFLCRPHLIDFDSNMLNLYTPVNEFITCHFSDKEKAIAWLANKKNS